MFLIGIVGIILLLWYFMGWMWQVAIPWLIVAVIVTSTIGWITYHWVIVLIMVVVGFGAYGAYLEYQEKKTK